MWLTVFLMALGIVAVAELGDKSQLMTISLASKYHHRPVFFGIFVGMALVTVLGVGVGTILYHIIPVFYIRILAALIFIVFGIYTLYDFLKSQEEADLDELEDEEHSKVFTTSFFLSVVAEFGDKTQLVIIALTARYRSPVPVLSGSLLALLLVIGGGVIIGTKLSDLVEREKIELVASLLFIVLGVAFLVQPFL